MLNVGLIFLFVPGIRCKAIMFGGDAKYNELNLDCAGQIDYVGCQKMECKHGGGKREDACRPLGGRFVGSEICRLEESMACYCNTTLCNKTSSKQSNSYLGITLILSLVMFNIPIVEKSYMYKYI